MVRAPRAVCVLGGEGVNESSTQCSRAQQTTTHITGGFWRWASSRLLSRIWLESRSSLDGSFPMGLDLCY